MNILGMFESETDKSSKIIGLVNPSNSVLRSILYTRGLYSFATEHKFTSNGNQKRCYTDGETVWKVIEDQNRYQTSLFEDIAEIIWTDHVFKNQLKVLGYDNHHLIVSQPYVKSIKVSNFEDALKKKMNDLGFHRTQALEDKIYLEGDTVENDISRLEMWKREDGFIVSDLKPKNVTYQVSSKNEIFIYDCSIIRVGFREDGRIF